MSTLAFAHSKRNMVSTAGRQELVVLCQSKLGEDATRHLKHIFLITFFVFLACFFFFFFNRKNWKSNLRATEVILEMLPLLSICFSEPLMKTYSFNEFVLLQGKCSWILLEVLHEQSLHKQVKN